MLIYLLHKTEFNENRKTYFVSIIRNSIYKSDDTFLRMIDPKNVKLVPKFSFYTLIKAIVSVFCCLE